MNLSEPFIRRPVATTLLTIGLALSGILGFRSLPLLFLLILGGMTATYLVLVEAGKSFFFRHERAA